MAHGYKWKWICYVYDHNKNYIMPQNQDWESEFQINDWMIEERGEISPENKLNVRGNDIFNKTSSAISLFVSAYTFNNFFTYISCL